MTPPGSPGVGGDLAWTLPPGQDFGPRYRIVRLIGVGGMGAVYEADDRELAIVVALKTVRPDAMQDPIVAAELEQRFKRELLLAREVTHKNVVRIYDLGEVEGTKYITMSCVDGETLESMLRRTGRLPVRDALGIARQVASGLAAAHEAGVVHRDLKPANVMVDRQGHALIMDFGIARWDRDPSGDPVAEADHSRQSRVRQATAAETMSGVVVGTVEYMAPEQALGRAVDHRADIYAFGLMLHDMLVGPRTEKAGGEELTERMRAALPGLRTIDATLPEAVEEIVTTCVQPDPAARYATTSELVRALERLDADGHPVPERRLRWWPALAAGLFLAAAAAAATFWATRPEPPPPQHAPVSVLIADFDNRTGETVFTGTIEQALAVDVEGAPFVSVYPQRDARALARKLVPSSNGRLDAQAGQLVARREGVALVVTGDIERAAGGYRLALRLVDPAGGKVISSTAREARDRSDVLRTVGLLAADARLALGETKAEMAEAETFTASSLDAVRAYTVAQELAASYKDDEAIAHYRVAVEKDPDFGRAYAGWAYSAFMLGRKDEAAALWKKALARIDRMTEREKYRTLGLYYGTVSRDYEKAIDNYTSLVRQYPADGAGHNNLALAYFSTRNFARALEEGKQALRIYPQRRLYRSNAALYAMYAGDFATAAAEAGRLVAESPDHFPGYLPLAIAALVRGKVDEARQAYRRMAASGEPGASLAATGLADLALAEGRPDRAVAILLEAIPGDRAGENLTGAAAKYVALAEAQQAAARKAPAARAARDALALSRTEETAVPAARVLVWTGDTSEPARLARELARKLEPQTRAHAHLIDADLAASRRDHAGALEQLRTAQKLADLWLVREALGQVYLAAERDAEAISEFELCQKRRGEATAVFLDDVPTFRYVARVPYWLARAQQRLGLNEPARAGFRTFLTMRSPEARDALTRDARTRLGAR